MEREDLREFLHFLDESDMTEEEKLDYLEVVWNIADEFAALGWGMHPLQQAQRARKNKKDRVYLIPGCLTEADKDKYGPFFPEDEDDVIPDDEA